MINTTHRRQVHTALWSIFLFSSLSSYVC